MNKHTKHHLGVPLNFDWREKGYDVCLTEIQKDGTEKIVYNSEED